MRRAAVTVRKGWSAGFSRATFNVLFLVLSLSAHLTMTAASAATADATWRCAPSELGAQADGDARGPRTDHAGAGFDHCSDCTMATSPTLPAQEPFHYAALPEVRFVFFYTNWIDPIERRGAGEKRSRAPPACS